MVRETATGERRVALVPEVLGKLSALGATTLVERGAGARATFGDEAFAQAGAELTTAEQVYARADVVVRIGPPTPQDSDRLRSGQLLIGLLRPWERPAEVLRWAQRGVTAVALDYLPRTLSRAQIGRASCRERVLTDV